MRPYTFANYRVQRGLSLIELMISITIGLLILVALTTLFVNQSWTRAELDKSTRMIENGRYAMELLSEDLRLAGFYGELNPSTLALPTVLTDPCSTIPANMTNMLRIHVGGFDAAGVNSSIASPPCGLTNLKNGSDILVLQRADTATPVAQSAAVNGIHYIQVSRCGLDIPNFVISNIPANFTRRTFTPATATTSRIDCTATSVGPYADLRRFSVHTYFVSTDNNPGDGIPTLKRMELDPAGSGTYITTPLVEGIDYMQVEYGVDGADTDGDGIPDSFNSGDLDGEADYYGTCSACTIAQWANVVTVKIYIIARNIEKTPGYTDEATKTYTLGQAGTFGPFNDSIKRHVYTQVVRLINPSSRKETP